LADDNVISMVNLHFVSNYYVDTKVHTFLLKTALIKTFLVKAINIH